MGALRMLSILAIFICFVYESELLDNGLARTPPMGWMSWGFYGCTRNCSSEKGFCLNEALIMDVADKLYTEGYQEAGFEYIVIDDCWSEPFRDLSDNLVPSKTRFPRGMKFLADYIHSKGLKFGMYTNIAAVTCEGYPGSKGYFDKDAKQFAEWEIDYLKVDGCFIKSKDYLDKAYIELGRELNKTGRPIVYSCSWPYYRIYIHKDTPKYELVKEYCNLWRNTHDIKPAFGNIYYTIKEYEKNNTYFQKFHGPGHWHDPDMLLIGDETEEAHTRLQLVVYAMLSAPLMLSCNMSSITPGEKQLLLNLDFMAIAKDPLGIMATSYELDFGITLWVKRHLPIKGDTFPSISFAVVSMELPIAYSVSFKPSKYGANSTDGYTLYNLLNSRLPLRNISSQEEIEVIVKPTDVVLLTLYPL